MAEEKGTSCGGEIGDLKREKHGRMVAALKMKGSVRKNAGETPGGQASHKIQCQSF